MLKRVHSHLIVIASISMLLFGSIVYAAPFTNGSFEAYTGLDFSDPFITIPSGNTNITGWTVSLGNIDYIGNLWATAEGARSLDLDGSVAVGGIEQAFDTVAGHQYEVTFYLAGNYIPLPAIKTLNVGATGNAVQGYAFDATLSSPSNMGWTQHTYSFIASSSTTALSFVSTTTGPNGETSFGPALDNVSVNDLGVPISAPEPATMFFLALGLLGLAGQRRRFEK
jgi:choice-of-anchor C domain-containing protein